MAAGSPKVLAPAVTLADLAAAEQAFKKARLTFEELNRAGNGGSFVVQGKPPFAFPTITVEVKPRGLYQRFYHHVTSSRVIEWLASSYGDRLRAMLHAAREEPGLCRLVGAGRKRGRQPVMPGPQKTAKQVALAFAPCLALVANDHTRTDEVMQSYIDLDILNQPHNLVKIPAVRAAFIRWDAVGGGKPNHLLGAAAHPASGESNQGDTA